MFPKTLSEPGIPSFTYPMYHPMSGWEWYERATDAGRTGTVDGLHRFIRGLVVIAIHTSDRSVHVLRSPDPHGRSPFHTSRFPHFA